MISHKKEIHLSRNYSDGFRHCMSFSPFPAVSLCRVAGLAVIFPSLAVSGPSLPDLPGFHVSSDSVLPSQLNPLGRFSYIFISATALMFSVSSLLFMSNHSNLLLLATIPIGSMSLNGHKRAAFSYFKSAFV